MHQADSLAFNLQLSLGSHNACGLWPCPVHMCHKVPAPLATAVLCLQDGSQELPVTNTITLVLATGPVTRDPQDGKQAM